MRMFKFFLCFAALFAAGLLFADGAPEASRTAISAPNPSAPFASRYRPVFCVSETVSA